MAGRASGVNATQGTRLLEATRQTGLAVAWLWVAPGAAADPSGPSLDGALLLCAVPRLLRQPAATDRSLTYREPIQLLTPLRQHGASEVLTATCSTARRRHVSP